MAHVVTERCVDCRYTDCCAVCPVDCFYQIESPAMLHCQALYPNMYVHGYERSRGAGSVNRGWPRKRPKPWFSARIEFSGPTGGCSGFSYSLDLTETKTDNDEVSAQHGIDVICDSKSNLYLDGTKVDFKDEVMGRGFVFENPNATSSCGCGSSFSV